MNVVVVTRNYPVLPELLFQVRSKILSATSVCFKRFLDGIDYSFCCRCAGVPDCNLLAVNSGNVDTLSLIVPAVHLVRRGVMILYRTDIDSLECKARRNIWLDAVH